MKFKNISLQKTIEILEKEVWGEPEFDSKLVETCYKLRKKQLKDFSIEDLRIMIGQNIGLKFLIPLAIEKLEKDILAEGDFYKGDLLKMILTSDINYWKKEKDNWKVFCDLFEDNKTTIDDFCYQNGYRNEWLNEFKKFKKINS